MYMHTVITINVTYTPLRNANRNPLIKNIMVMTTIYNPVLWGIIGTEEISKQIVNQFDIQKHIMKQTAIKNISRGDECWILEVDKGVDVCANKVIFCCDTKETYRICKNIFTEWRFFLIKKFIQYCNSLFENCFACVHDYKDILPEETIKTVLMPFLPL